MNNKQRSHRFETIIIGLRDDNGDYPLTTLIDLMADAMHWCDHNDFDFYTALAQASRYYDNELNEEQQEEPRLPGNEPTHGEDRDE